MQSTVSPPMFLQVMMSHPRTEMKIQEACLKKCAHGFHNIMYSFKQFSFFRRCLRVNAALTRGSSDQQRKRDQLDDMLRTTKMLAEASLERFAFVRQSQAPVDTVLFPGSTDSGKCTHSLPSVYF